MNWYNFWADVIVTIHLGIVSFVLFGLLLVLAGIVRRWQWVRNFWFRLAHLLTIGIVAFESLVDVECPFTTWENLLRAAAGKQVSEASFVGRLMHDLLFYDASPQFFTVCYCLFGLVVLATFFLAPPRWPWRKRQDARAIQGPHGMKPAEEPIPTGSAAGAA